MSIYLVVLALIVAFYWYGAISAWRLAFIWFGSQAIDGGLTVLRLRLSQPFYFGSFTYFIVVFLVGCIWFVWVAEDRPTMVPVLFILVNIASILFLAQPPAAVFLAASGKPARELYNGVRRRFEGHALSLIRPPEFTIFATYYQRTSEKKWKETVVQLVKFSPIIVVDARSTSQALVEEVEWLHELHLVDKTLFIVADNGTNELLDKIGKRGFSDTNSVHRQVRQSDLTSALSAATDRHLQVKMLGRGQKG